MLVKFHVSEAASSKSSLSSFESKDPSNSLSLLSHELYGDIVVV